MLLYFFFNDNDSRLKKLMKYSNAKKKFFNDINEMMNFYAPPTSPIYFSSNRAFISFSSSQTRIGIGGFSFEWKTVEKSKLYIFFCKFCQKFSTIFLSSFFFKCHLFFFSI